MPLEVVWTNPRPRKRRASVEIVDLPRGTKICIVQGTEALVVYRIERTPSYPLIEVEHIGGA